MLYVFRALDAVWRRRVLFAIPCMILIPVSIALSLLVPAGYAARSLVMLQEGVATDPLSRDSGSITSDRISQVVVGLRTLLASDLVLSQVIDERQPGLDSVSRAAAIRGLRAAVTINLIGQDFLEFQLVGGQARGLGTLLSSIMSKFTETLVSRGGITVGTFLLENRRSVLDGLEAKFIQAKHEHEELVPGGKHAIVARVKQLQTEIYSIPKADSAETQRGAELRSEVMKLEDVLREAEVIEQKLAKIESEIAASRQAYDDTKLRLDGVRASPGAALMKAPDRMVVIDAPRDPLVPLRSRWIFALSGTLGAILLGAALVCGMELADQTLRSGREFAAFGIPILVRLPCSTVHAEKRGRA